MFLKLNMGPTQVRMGGGGGGGGGATAFLLSIAQQVVEFLQVLASAFISHSETQTNLTYGHTPPPPNPKHPDELYFCMAALYGAMEFLIKATPDVRTPLN